MFDPSAPHIIILLIVVLLLFGASRLPGAAAALGKSMHIFRRSVKGEDPDLDQKNVQVSASFPAASLPGAAAPASATQAELQDLKRRMDELQARSAGGDGTIVSGVPLSETQRNQQQL
jgi:sec-independent protein translocase protein TatA